MKLQQVVLFVSLQQEMQAHQTSWHYMHLSIKAIPQFCAGKEGGRVIMPSCNIRFEVYFLLWLYSSTINQLFHYFQSQRYPIPLCLKLKTYYKLCGHMICSSHLNNWTILCITISHCKLMLIQDLIPHNVLIIIDLWFIFAGNGTSTSRTVIIIVVPTVAFVVLIVSFCIYLRVRKPRDKAEGKRKIGFVICYLKR